MEMFVLMSGTIYGSQATGTIYTAGKNMSNSTVGRIPDAVQGATHKGVDIIWKGSTMSH